MNRRLLQAPQHGKEIRGLLGRSSCVGPSSPGVACSLPRNGRRRWISAGVAVRGVALEAARRSEAGRLSLACLLGAGVDPDPTAGSTRGRMHSTTARPPPTFTAWFTGSECPPPAAIATSYWVSVGPSFRGDAKRIREDLETSHTGFMKPPSPTSRSSARFFDIDSQCGMGRLRPKGHHRHPRGGLSSIACLCGDGQGSSTATLVHRRDLEFSRQSQSRCCCLVDRFHVVS